MADNSATVSMSNPTLPLFKGENYEFWSIKMKTLFKSHGIWELVENGAANTPEDQKKDAKALFFIQQAVHDTIFSKIAAANSAKEAWTTLKTAFQGNSRVVAIKLQGLRRDFETLNMNHGETVQNFLTRVSSIVNQIRGLGEEISEKTIVAKVLRSLLPKFDHVVAAIEESKDLSTYTFDELMGSLQVHEVRLNKSYGDDEGYEKALYMKGESSRDRSRGNQQYFNQAKNGLECYYCHKFGHVQANCYKKQRDESRDVECCYCHKFGHVEAKCYKKKREEEQVSFVEEKNNQPCLFLAVKQPQIAKVQDSFDVTTDSKLKEQLQERDKYILDMELKLQEKEKELCARRNDNEAKDKIIKEKDQELAMMRRERDNSKVERDQHLQQIHDLQEQLGEKEKCMYSLEEQHKVVQHNLIIKETQLMEAHIWLSRMQETGILQSTTNQILQAELHARTEQFNQFLLNLQRQYVEMEKNYLEVIKKLQLEVNFYKDKTGSSERHSKKFIGGGIVDESSVISNENVNGSEKIEKESTVLQNMVLHEGSKHVNIVLQIIRDLVANQQVELKCTSMKEQVADILIKTLDKDKFEFFRNKFGLVDFGSRGSVES